ncbi:flagellar basal-body MS-ring/collar protein FliF [Limnohabitans sp. MMS-10A-178]|uniref:flagellar basal-body MS-ring/collar protein FliF n=1 Tax=Limnohabitans sp. MMS-10A-178 TaxID=1835767 RepID=UPI000D38E61D|nr:flagellar basal-body MS-ring/collar protein FliF [Limnohabitans sp. MMS-10A-178]PUE16472.1 flagellar M-ring protein FliF [Limnohabitans sp. MMS-10A-178]
MDAPKTLSPDRDAVVLSMGGSGAANLNTPAGVVDSLRERFQALTTNQRLFMGLGFAGLVLALGVVLSAGKSSQDYRVLFANVNEGDGAAIVTALQQMNVPYQFTEGGGAITVPQALVYETRLKLAGQGLPKAGNVGFELLENQKFGTSQFVERVNYLRGLEGELARSVSSLGQVKSARVHLAVPKPSAFVREQERPTASVILTLHPGRMLDSPQIAAIARLVSSAVPGMRVQEVSIMDTEGGILGNSAARQEGLDPSQLKYTSELEAALNRRVAAILEPLAGKDGFRAQVTVDLDFDERERTSETFGKNSPPDKAIRSQMSIEASGGKSGSGGVPGSLTNQPQDPAKAPITTEARGDNLRAPGSIDTGASGSEEGSSRNEKTVNFEVDRAIERIKSSKGQLRRVSAAVVLDYKYEKGAKANATRTVAYTPQEIQQINALVRDAIGFVQLRGDTVSVANLPFSEEPVPVAEDPGRLTPELTSQLIRYGAIALGLLFAYFAIARPLMRPVPLPPIDPDLPNSPQGRAAQRMREEIKELDLSWAMEQEVKRAQELRVEREIEAQMERMREREMASKAKFEDVVAYATQYATDQPDDTALLLRAWVSEKGPANAPGQDKS